MNRKSVIKIWIVATVMVFLFTSCEREKIISSSDLPSEITSYISTHFPNNVIIQVVLERDGLTKTYDILLSESISLEFNRKKEIIDIDGVTQLPNSVIPEKSCNMLILIIRLILSRIGNWSININKFNLIMGLT